MKTQQTLELEKMIYKRTKKQGVFGCFEVTIGWFGKERVDYITYDTNDVFKCYEIKVSKSDFHSKCNNTFLGDYNYYVMPKELYEQVKDEIPDNIGVYINRADKVYCIKKAKKNEIVDKENLKSYMIRSLSRDVEKAINSQDIELITKKKNRISKLEKELSQEKRSNQEFRNRVYEKYGRQAYRELM